MQHVKIYTTGTCPYCIRAKQLLAERGVTQLEEIRVDLAPGRVRVQDDGAGVVGRRLGNGLSGLRERVEAVGGALILTSPAPDGTDARPGTILEVTL